MKQIKMDYRVEFEDGLKDQVAAYYIGDNDMHVQWATAFIGVGAHIEKFTLKENNLEDALTKEKPNIYEPIGVNISGRISTNIKCNPPEIMPKDRKRKILEFGKENRRNIIQVYQLEDMLHAISCHFDNYANQFEILAKDFGDNLYQFIKYNERYFSNKRLRE